MLDLLHQSIRLVRTNLDKNKGSVELDEAIDIEQQIDALRDELVEKHYERLEEKSYSNRAGFIYLDYLKRMEKIGDHLFNVSEALAGRKIKSAYARVVEERN